MALFRVLMVRQVGRGLPQQGMAYILIDTDPVQAFERARKAYGSNDAVGAVVEQHPDDAVLSAGWSTYDPIELNRARWLHTWIPIEGTTPSAL